MSSEARSRKAGKNLFWLLFILFLTAEIYSQDLSNNLMNIHFTDKNNGTVVGDHNGEGVVMRTTDGGTHWITKYTALGGGRIIKKKIAAATGALAPAGGVDCNADGTIEIPVGRTLDCRITY